MLEALSRRWWVFLLRGIAGIVLGILAFAWPGITLLSFVIVFAAYLLVDGVFAVIAALSGEAGSRWGLLLFEGILAIVVAILLWAYPGMSAIFFIYFFAAWAIVSGIAEIVFGVQLRDVITNEWLYVLGGIVSIIFGIWVMREPLSGGVAIVWIMGSYAIAFGIIQLILAFRVRSLKAA
ncbi:MAG: HdeD family acid-resistance protein [Candidatus Eremiobacteraeota bacterium]|nr:HdeD family acid-resistance protein [Candidatus Eremiobacteraeota bacterium]